MVLSKRATEGVLNLIGSQTGTAWSLLEDFPLADLDSEKTFQSVLKILDSAFQYDDRVQLPSDFEAYFMAKPFWLTALSTMSYSRDWIGTR